MQSKMLSMPVVDILEQIAYSLGVSPNQINYSTDLRDVIPDGDAYDMKESIYSHLGEMYDIFVPREFPDPDPDNCTIRHILIFIAEKAMDNPRN